MAFLTVAVVAVAFLLYQIRNDIRKLVVLGDWHARSAPMAFSHEELAEQERAAREANERASGRYELHQDRFGGKKLSSSESENAQISGEELAHLRAEGNREVAYLSEMIRANALVVSGAALLSEVREEVMSRFQDREMEDLAGHFRRLKALDNEKSPLAVDEE